MANIDGTEFVTLVVTNVVRPEFDEQYREGSVRLARLVRENEPGTLLYTLSRLPGLVVSGVSVGDVFGHTYMWVERFRDEAALADHMSAPYEAEFLGQGTGRTATRRCVPICQIRERCLGEHSRGHWSREIGPVLMHPRSDSDALPRKNARSCRWSRYQPVASGFSAPSASTI